MRILCVVALLATLCHLARADSSVDGVLDRLVVKSGPYAGAVRLSPDGPVVWYFSNLGLYPLVSSHPGLVRRYLDCYLAHIHADRGTIDDVTADGRPMRADSHDAYAATLLRLAARYVEVSGDVEWARQRLPALKVVAYNAIAAQMKQGPVEGLIAVFRDAEATGYLMDNCEDYQGLRAFATLLARLGDRDAAYYRRVNATIANGVRQLYSSSARAWRLSDEDERHEHHWFPHEMAQMFPQLCGVPGIDRRTMSATERHLAQMWPIARRSADPYTRLLYAHYLLTCGHDAAEARRIFDELLPTLIRRMSTKIEIHELGYAVLVARQVGASLAPKPAEQ